MMFYECARQPFLNSGTNSHLPDDDTVLLLLLWRWDDSESSFVTGIQSGVVQQKRSTALDRLCKMGYRFYVCCAGQRKLDQH